MKPEHNATKWAFCCVLAQIRHGNKAGLAEVNASPTSVMLHFIPISWSARDQTAFRLAIFWAIDSNSF